MSDPIVVYDADKEIAALVDPDTRTAFGPAHIGPDAGVVLEGFLQSVPYDVTAVESAVLRGWFERYVSGAFPPPATATSEDTPVAAQPSGGSGVDETALAERASIAAGDGPPPPQPADTDMEADAGAADAVTGGGGEPPPTVSPESGPVRMQKVSCPACNATGSVPSSEPGVSVPCNLCKGTTQIEVPA